MRHRGVDERLVEELTRHEPGRIGARLLSVNQLYLFWMSDMSDHDIQDDIDAALSVFPRRPAGHAKASP